MPAVDTPLGDFFALLRDALAVGDARIAFSLEEMQDAVSRQSDGYKVIGFHYKEGVALVPQRAMSVASRRSIKTRKRDLGFAQDTIAHALARASYLIRHNKDRRDYGIRSKRGYMRVWYVRSYLLDLNGGEGKATKPSNGKENKQKTARTGGYRLDGFGLEMPRSLSRFDAQMIDALRFVGRVRYATMRYIRAFAYPTTARTTAYNSIAFLVKNDMLWEVPGRHIDFVLNEPVLKAHTPPGRKPSVYGLTPRGKAWLEDNLLEAGPRHYRVLKARDLSEQGLPERTMSHDMQVAWWLTSAVTALKHNKWCHGVYLETEFIVNDDQRIDAYLDIRFNLDYPRPDLNQFWHNEEPPKPGDRVVRLALEMDNDTEAPNIIHLKGYTYSQLTYNAVYSFLFNGPVIPVFIVPTVARKALVMREFASVWPGNWGICATSADCSDATGGTLWGLYHRMNELPTGTLPEVMRPLTLLERTADNTVSFQPAITARQWMSGKINELPFPER